MENFVTALWGKQSLKLGTSPTSASSMELCPTWACVACTYLNDSHVNPDSCAICGRYNPEYVNKLGVEEAKASLQVPKYFLCPITQDIMENPIVAADGYTYEKKALVKWIKKKGTSPVTREELSKDHLFPNRLLKKQIEEFRMRSRWVTTKAEVGTSLCSLEATEVRAYLRKKESEFEPERAEVKRKLNEVIDKMMNLEVEKEELNERLKELDSEDKENKQQIHQILAGYKKALEAVNAEQFAEGVKDPKVTELLDTIRLVEERIGVTL